MKKIFLLLFTLQTILSIFIKMPLAVELIIEGYEYEVYVPELESPTMLVFDSYRNLYVARDSQNSQEKLRIYKINSDLNVELIGPEIQDPDSIAIDTEINDTLYIGGNTNGVYSILTDGTSSVDIELGNINITGLAIDFLNTFSDPRSLYIAIGGTSTKQILKHNGRDFVDFELDLELKDPHALTFVDDKKYLLVASENVVYQILSDGRTESFVEFDNFVECIAYNKKDQNLYIGIISENSISDNKIYKVSLNAEKSIFAKDIKAYGIFIDDEDIFVSDRSEVPHRILKISKNATQCYTEDQVYTMISKILAWGDINKDNKIGLEEAIRALIIASGIKDNQ